jgi:predicted esterase
MRQLARILLCGLTTLVIWAAGVGRTEAVQLVLKDGRVLKGKLGLTAGLNEMPQPVSADGSGRLQLLLFVDDDLRRTFVSTYQKQDLRQDDAGEILEKFLIRQRVVQAGRMVKSVGPILNIQPFDEFGRRIFSMNTSQGPVDVIQGITEMTPLWTKVQGISHVWDMRLATSSIPRETISKILSKQVKKDDVEARKKVARFYLQSERYKEAYQELESILTDFADNAEVKKDLEPSVRALRQMSAQNLLAELRLRRQAGQHQLVRAALRSFPSEGVAGETLEAVKEILDEDEKLETQRVEILKQFETFLSKIDEADLRKRIEPFQEELKAELNTNTLRRMAAFRQIAKDQSLLPAEKVSVAISGWLLGETTTTVKLPVSLSLLRVRQLVAQYINTPERLRRAQILEQFRSEEGATPKMVAKLLAHMKPPMENPAPAADKPGYYELEVPGLSPSPPVPYLVQLPPEYDPLRRYPAIVTLHGAGSTTAQQIDWWAGAWNNGKREGQASRHGYIVIAPNWTEDHQTDYRYSAREHAAVLDSLRDACRRFSIDTDRVFLSGHSMGGNAAWDLGLAHPDLWAGVIPIVAVTDRYCSLYWKNAKLLPFYCVGGELDGTKLIANSRDLDRYLKRGFNTTVVEYLGRGHENFSDEIQRLFDWMERFKRNFFPKEFTCSTMRTWDNFFWYVELAQMPPKAMIEPVTWPPERGTQPVETEASLTANNGIFVTTGAGQVNIWLAPEMVNFERRVNIVVNGKRVNVREQLLEGNLETLLEDVRTRGDRQHPFWLKVEALTGRVSR